MDFLFPVKENMGKGTGIGTLIPTCPASMFFWNAVAVAPDFVKIDAEIADYEILMGMKETLRKCRPIISVEVGDMDIEGVRPSKDIVHFLVENGYQPYEYSDGEMAKHTAKDRYEYRDLLFLPKS